MERNPLIHQLTAAVSPPKQSLSLQTAGALAISMVGVGARVRHPERGGKNVSLVKSQPPTQTMNFITQLNHLCSTCCINVQSVAQQRCQEIIYLLNHKYIDELNNHPFKSKQGVSSKYAPGTRVSP